MSVMIVLRLFSYLEFGIWSVIFLFGCTLAMYLFTCIHKYQTRALSLFFLSPIIIPETQFLSWYQSRDYSTHLCETVLIHSHFFSSLIALILCDLQFSQAGLQI